MIRLLQKIEDMLAAVAFAEAGERETSMGFMGMETRKHSPSSLPGDWNLVKDHQEGE